jgi:hypothetical protein
MDMMKNVALFIMKVAHPWFRKYENKMLLNKSGAYEEVANSC